MKAVAAKRRWFGCRRIGVMLGVRVARKPDALVRLCGRPAGIVSDSGTELTSRAILKWADRNDVPWHYIDPSKPRATHLHRIVRRQPARRAIERGNL